ncbi:MAG: prenyltransferase/squalene oxidase repeat-containing protein [Planctomycetota bacterium]
MSLGPPAAEPPTIERQQDSQGTTVDSPSTVTHVATLRNSEAGENTHNNPDEKPGKEPDALREGKKWIRGLLDIPTTIFRGLFPSKDYSRAPAFLTSLITHTALLLLLVLISWPTAPTALRQSSFSMRASDSSLQTPVLELLAAGDSLAPPSPEFEKIDIPLQQAAQAAVALSEILSMEAPTSAESQQQGAFDHLLKATELSGNGAFASTGVEGRDQKRRRQVALENGGTIETEKAVEEALRWLAEHQRPNGSWSLLHTKDACGNDCPNEGSKDRFDTAATGLALLAFLGAGHTHREGEYRQVVRRGVYFLLQVMENTPQGASLMYQSERGMYNHGIASFAICEAYQLTSDPDLKKAAQETVDFIMTAQGYSGGWGYLPKKPGDLTLSGWQVMALKSAFAAGLDVSPSTIMRVDKFLDSQQMEGGVFYGYRKPAKSPTCTSIALLLRMFRGVSHTDPRILEGALFLSKLGPTRDDAYYNYYATLFLFHVGGPRWEIWNESMREHLIRSQAKMGHARGSWYFENAYGKEGGRLYTTAMCAMTLEVYYRYSPLYRQTDIDFEL